MKRLLLVIALIVLALGLFAFYALRHEVPKGQQPLAMLNASTIEGLKAEFNASADRSRLIVLLSPT